MKASRRTDATLNRLEAQQARQGNKEWIVNRRERTHRLIEFGGLVVKSGIDKLLQDDRAALYGGLLDLVFQLQTDPQRTIIVWRRRGQIAFKTFQEIRDFQSGTGIGKTGRRP